VTLACHTTTGSPLLRYDRNITAPFREDDSLFISTFSPFHACIVRTTFGAGEHLTLDDEGEAQATTPRTRYLTTGIQAMLTAMFGYSSIKRFLRPLCENLAAQSSLEPWSSGTLVGLESYERFFPTKTSLRRGVVSVPYDCFDSGEEISSV
jgi:hypothetical protein